MSLLDNLLLGYKMIVRKGATSVQRRTLEFVGDGVTLVDDPVNDLATLTITSTPNIPTNTLLGRDTPGTGPTENISLHSSLAFVSPQVLGIPAQSSLSFIGTVPAIGLLRTPHASTLWASKELGGTDRALMSWGV